MPSSLMPVLRVYREAATIRHGAICRGFHIGQTRPAPFAPLEFPPSKGLLTARSGFEGIQARFIECDVDGFFLRHRHGAGCLSFRPFDPFAAGIDHIPFPAFFQVTVKESQSRRVAYRFRWRLDTLVQSYDDMRTRCAARVKPEIFALRKSEGMVIVLAGIAADQDGMSIG